MKKRTRLQVAGAGLALAAVLCIAMPDFAHAAGRHFDWGPSVLLEGTSTVQPRRRQDLPSLMASPTARPLVLYQIKSSAEVDPAMERAGCRIALAISPRELIAAEVARNPQDPRVQGMVKRLQYCSTMQFTPEQERADCGLIVASATRVKVDDEVARTTGSSILAGFVKHCESLVREASASQQRRSSGFAGPRGF
jgi:hypothetical protein